MDDTASRVGLVAGPGLVGRFGEAGLPGAGGGGAPAGDLLDLVETAAAESARPGAVIAARLAGWLGRHAPAEVAFGLVAAVPDGVVVFLRGPVWAEVTGGARAPPGVRASALARGGPGRALPLPRGAGCS